MQTPRLIPVDRDALMKVSATGVSVGFKPTDKTAVEAEHVSARQIAVDVEALLKVGSTGVAVGTKPGNPRSPRE
jgi:hypothetical protein